MKKYNNLHSRLVKSCEYIGSSVWNNNFTCCFQDYSCGTQRPISSSLWFWSAVDVLLAGKWLFVDSRGKCSISASGLHQSCCSLTTSFQNSLKKTSIQTFWNTVRCISQGKSDKWVCSDFSICWKGFIFIRLYFSLQVPREGTLEPISRINHRVENPPVRERFVQE